MRRLILLPILLGLAAYCGCGARTEIAPEQLPPDASPTCGYWGGTCCGQKCAKGLACSAGTCIAVDGGAPPPSCASEAAGASNCGLEGDGGGGESCCTSLEVPTGTYFRTYTNNGAGPTGEADPATVSGFRLDKYLVTVGRFRRFVEAWNSGWRPVPGSGIHEHLNDGQGLANSASPGTFETGWGSAYDEYVAPTNANLACSFCSVGRPALDDTWTPIAGDNENLPINCTNWFDAYAFCIWDGGFLPSEAEWEYAAAGGNQQREYPWGAAAPGRNNAFAIYDCLYPRPVPCPSSVAVDVAPVGVAMAGAARWGQLDIAGEENEWTLDSWAPADVPNLPCLVCVLPYVDPCVDCTYSSGTLTPQNVILRGGAFDEPISNMLPPSRNQNAPSDRSPDIGVRCARSP